MFVDLNNGAYSEEYYGYLCWCMFVGGKWWGYTGVTESHPWYKTPPRNTWLRAYDGIRRASFDGKPGRTDLWWFSVVTPTRLHTDHMVCKVAKQLRSVEDAVKGVEVALGGCRFVSTNH